MIPNTCTKPVGLVSLGKEKKSGNKGGTTAINYKSIYLSQATGKAVTSTGTYIERRDLYRMLKFFKENIFLSVVS